MCKWIGLVTLLSVFRKRCVAPFFFSVEYGRALRSVICLPQTDWEQKLHFDLNIVHLLTVSLSFRCVFLSHSPCLHHFFRTHISFMTMSFRHVKTKERPAPMESALHSVFFLLLLFLGAFRIWNAARCGRCSIF